jgi:hypothetical protein
MKNKNRDIQELSAYGTMIIVSILAIILIFAFIFRF